MDVYFDSGALIPLYVEESFSEAVGEWVDAYAEPVPISLFHRLEMENAIRLKCFRGEMDEARSRATLHKIDSQIAAGLLIYLPTNWGQVLEAARAIGERVAAETGCRTLDLIHVAVALQWGCSRFVSADARQLAAARRERLRIVDVRALHRRLGGRSEPGTATEKRARYSARKRRRPAPADGGKA